MNKILKQLPPLETVTITALAYGGDGMGYDENGGTVFVPYGLPGDTVRVQVDHKLSGKGGGQTQKKWGKIVDVTIPSPDRLDTPPCTHCFDCGGCALQHMRMPAYQAWKYQSVIDRLAKAGMVPERAHPLISTPITSRRRATFAATRVRGRVIVGFNRHHSDDIIDLAECHVVMPDIMAVLPGVRMLMDVMLQSVRAADISVVILDHGLDVLITAPIGLDLMMRQAAAEFVQMYNVARLSIRAKERSEPEVILAAKPAVITVGGVPLTVPPGAFLQPSRAGEQALIDCVVAGVGDAAACVVDLFCGMGTFSYPLAVRGADVCGFDVDVASLQRSGVVFKSRNLYRDPLTARELADYDTIVFDPPRAGAKAQAPEIAESGVAKIVAVSCNPGTFISDCAPFLAAGYRFTDLWVVDQFIWSSHIEMVGVFVNKE